MNQAQAVVIVAAELRLFLRPGRRGGPVAVAVDGTSSLGHVVESLGVPLTEAGRLLVNGEPAAPGYRPRNGDVVRRRGRAATAAADARRVSFSMFTWARWRAGCDWPAWTPPTPMTPAMMPSSSRRTPAAGCCSPRTAACCAAGRCGWAPTCGARALMTSSGTCWTGSGRRWRHGPGARRATGRCPRSPRQPWLPCCRPAPGAPTRRSPAARSCGQVYWHGAHSKRLEQIIDSAVRAVSTGASE